MEGGRGRADYQRVKRTLRKLSLEDSLCHLWHFSRLVSGGVPLPYLYELNSPQGLWGQLRRYIFPHEIDIFARELILHADRSGRIGDETLADWKTLASAFQAIKDYGNHSFDPDIEGGVHLTLHQIAQQQFPHFGRFSKSKIGRYLALYGSDGLRQVFERAMKIDVEKYFVLSFGVIAGFYRNVRFNTKTDFSALGVGLEISEIFFSRIVGEIHEMRRKAIDSQRLDFAWEYSFNPFHYKPIVALDRRHPERVLCPIPSVLERRLLDGIYYDLVRDGMFSKNYGEAIENLFGRVLLGLSSRYKISKPDPVFANGRRFDGADWIVSDGERKVFVECKSKRMAFSGRVAGNLSDLNNEIGILADAFVQNYANIHREMMNESESEKRQSHFYNVVMTMEDWFIFSRLTFSMLRDNIKRKMEDRHLPASLLEVVPYRLLSFEGAQHWVEALKHEALEKVIGEANEEKYMGFAYLSFLHSQFPCENSDANGGFDADSERLFRELFERIK